MEKALRLLVLEDNPGDVGLIRYELEEANLNFELKHVLTKMDFLKELEDFSPDLILADYTIPGFNGMEALALVKELASVIPLIFVTGTIDEVTAVECMKAGATDYILKDSLKRIVPAIKSAIEKRDLNKEKKLLESNFKFAVNILENISDSIVVTNTEGVVLYWNKGAAQIFGYSSEEMVGSKLERIQPDPNSGQLENGLKSILQGKEYIGEWKGRKKGDGFVWVYSKTRLMNDGDDKVIGIIAVSQDITEMKKIQESILNTQEKSDTILNAIPDLLLRTDKELNILDFRIPKTFKYLKGPVNLAGKNIRDLPEQYEFISREMVNLCTRYISITLKTGKVQFLDYKLLFSNQILHFEARFMLSSPDEVLVMIRDITGVERSGDGQGLGNVNIPDSIIHFNTEGKIIYANLEMVNLLGYRSLNEFTANASIKNLISDGKSREELISTLILNESLNNREFVFKTRLGNPITLLLDARLVKEPEANNVYFELTAREKYEENLGEINMKKLQKLESINTIGSSIASDFNNIISALSMNIYITEQELPELHPAREHLNNIKNIFQQASELNGKLLNFNNFLKD
jgi:PAS domain S-box-containing protein